ncbi:MAG: hypothetical protein DMG79_05475 [Acidobacteria bacterium]|nr:MAG: hypothetical protein DMG79_05475 [Acidobacteriota bacterium]
MQPLSAVRELRPDLVIVDIGLPGLNGIQETAKCSLPLPEPDFDFGRPRPRVGVGLVRALTKVNGV